jgi:outer membrane receptor protein involved in Fe transport
MYMRGSGVNDNDVRINGIPVPYLYHFGGLRSTINPSLVSDFNVFLGGFPVNYGDNLGGAIDVRLRSPRTDRLHQHYHIGTFESSFLLEGPAGESGKDGFYIAARRSYIDLLLSPERMTRLISDDDDDRETEHLDRRLSADRGAAGACDGR